MFLRGFWNRMVFDAEGGASAAAAAGDGGGGAASGAVTFGRTPGRRVGM